MKRLCAGLLALLLVLTLSWTAVAEALEPEEVMAFNEETNAPVEAPVAELEEFTIGNEEEAEPPQDGVPVSSDDGGATSEEDQAVLSVPGEAGEPDGADVTDEEYAVEAAASGVAINATNFPNKKFRNYVSVHIDTNHDGVLTYAERTKVTDMDIDNKGICNLTGIQYFDKLKKLSCSSNGLLALNLYGNPVLESLDCSDNKLTSLDLRPNAMLTTVWCSNNQLGSLNVSSCTKLKNLFCQNNKLPALDISVCPLGMLSCQGNPIARLDISKNKILVGLYKGAFGGEVIRDAGKNYIEYDDDLNYCMTYSSTTLLMLNGVAVDGSSCTHQNVRLSNTGANGSITLGVGEARQIVPSFAIDKNWQVKSYASSKQNVVELRGDGLAIARSAGKATLTVTSANGKKAKITVKVIDPYKPKKVAIKQGKSVKLELGKKLKLETQLTPGNARATLTWKSSKEKVAVVASDGTVTAINEGTTKITVKTHNGKKASIKVKVFDPHKPKKVSITNGKSVTMQVGQELKLATALTPSTAKTTLTWKSSKEKVATVDANGTVKALKTGTTKITVKTANGKKASIKVKVQGAKNVDLTPWFGKSTTSFGKKFNVKVQSKTERVNVDKKEWGFDHYYLKTETCKNQYFEVVGYATGDTSQSVKNAKVVIDVISIGKASGYSIFGVKVGMSSKEAYAAAKAYATANCKASKGYDWDIFYEDSGAFIELETFGPVLAGICDINLKGGKVSSVVFSARFGLAS